MLRNELAKEIEKIERKIKEWKTSWILYFLILNQTMTA